MSVIEFPGQRPRKRRSDYLGADDLPQVLKRERRRADRSMHSVVFRSYDLILEADEADLVRDVNWDIEKAKRKLAKAQQQLRSVRANFAAQEAKLTAVDAKLSAAVVAAILSTVKR